MHFGDDCRLVGHSAQRECADHGVEARVAEWHLLGVGVDQIDLDLLGSARWAAMPSIPAEKSPPVS